MEANKCIINIFLSKLFTYLTGHEIWSTNGIRIFRKHKNKLDVSGDFSFPLNLSGWEKHVQDLSNKNNKIFYLIDKFEKKELHECDFDDLIQETKSWNTIQINKIKLQESRVNVFLNRRDGFKIIITKILAEKVNYGSYNLKIKVILNIADASDDTTDLTSLRLSLLKNLTENILKTGSCNSNDCDSNTIYLTNRSISNCTDKRIVCGSVISNRFGKKNTNISAEQFYKKRSVEMQLMAQHKYGIRVNSDQGWADLFKRLGDAAVKIDLLHVKPNRPIIINEDCASSTCSKGASFILYNCARLAEIFKKFDGKVERGEMEHLPHVDNVDFTLLNQLEEWQLLFVYLMQYAATVQSCVQHILDGELSTNNLCVFLDSLCSVFSIYYRRVRVLTESRPHLLPVMYARIYLLKAIQQVLHNALALLDIQPVQNM